jgi:anti-sigma regulatory factor (Ser/Thr protein kinase)
MRIVLGPGDDGLASLSRQVDAFADRRQLRPDVRRDLHLVLDEVINNIVRHAHPRHPEVVVHLTMVDGALQIRIVDDGEAFDPGSRPYPDTTLGLEERPVGGLGIFLVRQLMTEVRYRRLRGRNHLTLRRSLAPSGASV